MRVNLSLLLVLLAFMQVGAASYAQKITLKEHNASLEQVFQAIKRQSGYVFVYNTEDLKNTRVNINVRNSSISETMEACLEGLPFTFKIIDNNILVKAKKEENMLDRLIDYFNQVNVKGTVSDEKSEPLPGATIKVKGTDKVVVSDLNGEFTLANLEQDAVLIVSYTGFVTQEVELNGRSQVSVILKEDLAKLSEVVVVGYGTQKRANLTGALTTVDMDKTLGDRPVSTVGSLLQGIVPGLQVEIGSGEPGAGKSMNLRGATSINLTGNSVKTDGPLIVIDNVPLIGPWNMLDPNDIESITVLKDAASAAIYGARSGFGVVLITTKKGKKNTKTRFNYSNNLTFSSPISLPEKATVRQTIQSYIDMGTTSYWTGQDPLVWMDLLDEYEADRSKYPDGYTTVNGVRYQLASSDAFDNLFQNKGFQFHQNLSVNGGSDKTTYRLSFGTVNEDGILYTDKDSYKRYNIKSIVTSDITPWFNAQLDMSYYNAAKSYPDADGLGLAPNLPPYAPMADSLEVNGAMYAAGTPKMNLLQSAVRNDRFDDMRLTGRAIFTPVKGLTVTGEYTFDNLRRLSSSYDKKVTSVEVRKFEVATSGTELYRKQHEITDYRVFNFYADYKKSINDHNFSILGGYSQESSSYEEEMVSKTTMINPELPSIVGAIGLLDGADGYSEYAIRGVFGRFNYDYKGKYLFEVNGRYDASSKFPPGRRSVFFPSFSAGWHITDEDFSKPLQPWLSDLKLRASLGSVGNQNINAYEFVQTMDPVLYPTWLNSQGQQVVTLKPPGLVSSNFTWSTVQTLDFGVDFGFLKNRLYGSFDWYQRDVKDILYQGIELPAVLGTQSPLQNVAALRAKGFEVEVNWRDRIGKVGYNIGVNLYDSQSEITKIKNEGGLISQYYVGQELGEIWGYTTDRLYTVDDFEPGTLGSNLTGGTLKPGIPRVEGINPNPGDVLYKDFNDDGIINPGQSTLSDPGDRRVIANESLRFQFGVRGGVSWNNFDFSFLMTGVGKNDQWRENLLKFPNGYAFGTLYAHQLDYWTPDNPNSYWGRIYDQKGGNQNASERVQTKYMYNGAYLRMKNLTLAYNVKGNILEKAHINSFQVFCSVENAFSLDHMPKGIEADIVKSGTYGFGYPYMRMTSFGVNLSF